MRVRIRVKSLLRQVEPVEGSVRLVKDVDADLLLNHAALVIQVLDRKIQGLHAVGFQPQHRIERGDWSRLDVLGEVVTRIAIVEAASALDHAVKNTLRRIGRAFKHHVLEEMGEAGAALRFQTEANPIADTQPEGRRGVVLGDRHGQAIG